MIWKNQRKYYLNEHKYKNLYIKIIVVKNLLMQLLHDYAILGEEDNQSPKTSILPLNEHF